MQTAVEWLQNEINCCKEKNGIIDSLIEQAKEMEKQQIIDAFYQCGRDNFEHIKVINRSATDYYNETYGSKGSDEIKNDYAKFGIIDNVDYWEKTLEYWKAEKEIANIGSTYYGLCCARIGIIEDFFKSIQPIEKSATSSQTEISDEEIWQEADKEKFNTQHYAFMRGAKWYREQLKKKQCN